MAAVDEQVKEFPKVKEWPGKARRPHLEVRAASGARLDPKTGEPIESKSKGTIARDEAATAPPKTPDH